MILLKNGTDKENKELIVSIQIFAQAFIGLFLFFNSVQVGDLTNPSAAILALALVFNATRQAVKLNKGKY